MGTSRRATVKPNTTQPPPAGRTSGEGKGDFIVKKRGREQAAEWLLRCAPPGRGWGHERGGAEGSAA